MKEIRVLSADRYVIALKHASGYKKLFQIVCSNDGSLYVAFPYTPFEASRLGKLKIEAHTGAARAGDDFPVTTEKVKYSHHPSGVVHFSQSGRIKTDIRKRGLKFDDAQGHLFSAIFQGIDRYSQLVEPAKNSPKRIVVPYDLGSGCATAKFVAHLHSEAELKRRVIGSGSQLYISCLTSDGRKLRGVNLATKYKTIQGTFYLFLTVESAPRLFQQGNEMMLFCGGFDPPQTMLDHSKDAHALLLLSPEHSYSRELVERVGTVDLKRRTQS